MNDLLMPVLKISLTIFMAGNLLDMGLHLRPLDAVGQLRNVRFVCLTLLWGFVVGPALAYFIPLIIPLQREYATGLLLLGMAPCAPFVPAIVSKAKGDLGFASAFMVLCAVGTVVFMPLAVPLMIKGLTVSAWAIARPMVMVILIPLAAGLLILYFLPAFGSRMQPAVRRITQMATIVMLFMFVAIYGKSFIGIRGSFAIVALMIFCFVMTAFPYWFGFGMPHRQKVVMSTGMATRNIGAALAPLIAAPGIDPRANVMIVLGFLVMVPFAMVAARRYSRSG
jgi:BASS family bile acid:Na+ symporter